MFPSGNLQELKSVPTAFLPAAFEKVAGRYESLLFLFFFYYQILIFFGPNPFPSVLLHAQISCRPNSFSRPGVDAISRDRSRMQIQNRLD